MLQHERFRETEPRIFSTDSEDPESGRVFVWAWTEWFERVEGETGAVAFTPVADSEPELRRWLKQNCPDDDLLEITGEFADQVEEEFLDQSPLFPESPETSSETPFSEQMADEDIEHY